MKGPILWSLGWFPDKQHHPEDGGATSHQPLISIQKVPYHFGNSKAFQEWCARKGGSRDQIHISNDVKPLNGVSTLKSPHRKLGITFWGINYSSDCPIK